MKFGNRTISSTSEHVIDPIFSISCCDFTSNVLDDDKEQKVAHEMVHFSSMSYYTVRKTTSNSKNDDDWSQVLCHWFSQSPEMQSFS